MLKKFLLLILLSGAVWAAPGDHLKVGEAITAVHGIDQFGEARQFSNLAGPNGLVVLIFRSADW